MVTGHSRSVPSVVWTNDGTKLVTGSYDDTVKVWSMGSARTFECQSTLNEHLGYVSSVAWNNDGRKLVTGSNDETVRIWSLGTGETLPWGRGLFDSDFGRRNGHPNWVPVGCPESFLHSR